MLNEDKARKLLDCENLYFADILHLDCRYNHLHFPHQKLSIALQEGQKRLLICLLHNVFCKQEIIKVVWNDNHQRIRDNNYHQLVFQLRALLQRHGLPNNLIITVPYYGLKLNEPLLNKLACDKSQPEAAASKKNWIPQLVSFARSIF